MLFIIGLGLNDEGDLTLKAIDCLRKSEKVYAEFYTNIWQGDLRNLQKIIGKNIDILDREKVESSFLIEEAGHSDISLLVPGDPLSATTHYELFALARDRGIKCNIIHAPSIYTAVAKTGLQLYKFGRSTTLPKPQKGYEPSSPYDAILSNQKLGYHTLVLLDIGMTVNEAIDILRKLDNNSILVNRKIIVCSMLGNEKEKIVYGKIEDIEKMQINSVPSVIIVPGNLNFKEEEYLSKMV